MVYSVGSNAVVEFEEAVLKTTECDVHVFDPTVLPSTMRALEARVNAPYQRKRAWFHNYGVGAHDGPMKCAPTAGMACGCSHARVA